MVMKKSDITYIVGSVFAAATALFYCGTMWFHIKLPRYYPTEHTWKWVNEKGIPSQGWYGMQAFAFLAGAVVAIVVYMLLKRNTCKQMTLKPYAAKFLGLMTIALVTFCLGYIFCHEFTRWGVFSSLASGSTVLP